MEDLVLLDQKDHKEIRVTLVLMAHLDPPEMMVNMEKEVLLVLKEKKENLVFKEVLVLEVHLVWRDQKEIQELLVSLEILVNRGKTF